MNDYMTIEYFPPELIDEKKPSMKTDSWAAGIIFFKLCSGNIHPFNIRRKNDEQKILIFKNDAIVFEPKYF